MNSQTFLARRKTYIFLNLWIKAKIHVLTLWGLDLSPGCGKQKYIMSLFDYDGFQVCGYVGIKVYEFVRAKKFM